MPVPEGWAQYSGPVELTKDGKYTMSYYSVDFAGNQEQEHSIDIALDSTAPEINVTQPADGGRYTIAEDLKLQVSIIDHLSGVDGSKTVIKLDGKTIQPDAAIKLYTIPLGAHTLTVSAADLAGNAQTATVSFRTIVTIESLKALIARLLTEHGIDNAGIANSLQQKLEHGDVREFMKEVQAQRGKHITEETADLLLLLAQTLENTK